MNTSPKAILALFATMLLASGTECAAADGSGAIASPVVRQDWPDPAVVSVEEEGTIAHYLVSTGGRLPIRRSLDLVRWEETGAALLPAGRAPWSPDGERNWAPEIHRVGGRFVAYYTASSPPSAGRADPLAIGAAWADHVLGPYHHLDRPLVEAGALGVIDASQFTDSDGTPYLYWKTDGNCCGVATEIVAQQLSPDGLSFAPGSRPKTVLRNDLPWEGTVVEAPWVEHRNGYYYLFYSANDYHEPYRTGIARGSSPLGPFVKQAQPLLSSTARVQGPGHGSVVCIDSVDFLVHHGWVGGRGRYLFVSKLAWMDGWPIAAGGPPPAVPLPER